MSATRLLPPRPLLNQGAITPARLGGPRDRRAAASSRLASSLRGYALPRAVRAVLSARSTYFRSMFKSNCREAQPGAVIQVGETTAAAFRLLLAYLYTDALDGLDDEVVLDVMRKARE